MRQWQSKWSLAAVVLAVSAAVVLQAGPAQSVPPPNVGVSAQVAALQSAVAALQTQVAGQQDQINTLQGTGNSQTEAITALQGTVAALQATVNSQNGLITGLQNQVTTLQGQVNGQQAAINSLQAQQNNPVLALGPYVSVVTGELEGMIGPHIIFEGANIHVLSGKGCTHDDQVSGNVQGSGLGNLVIGYNEKPQSYFPSRHGAHNLVVGPEHSFSSTGGLVAGEHNWTGGKSASVTGGTQSCAIGLAASVSGGFQNKAQGNFSSVAGGESNQALGQYTAVAGGGSNWAQAVGSSILGGANNWVLAGAEYSSIGGGSQVYIDEVHVRFFARGEWY